jgi:hypothetical protein
MYVVQVVRELASRQCTEHLARRTYINCLYNVGDAKTIIRYANDDKAREKIPD